MLRRTHSLLLALTAAVGINTAVEFIETVSYARSYELNLPLFVANINDAERLDKAYTRIIDSKIIAAIEQMPLSEMLCFDCPTDGRYTSTYGRRWGRQHHGIDIANSVGTPIYAAESGTVICSEYVRSFGNIVKIDHGDGIETYYAHNSRNIVEVGMEVKKGDLIALMGSTGNSTGSHCHFEVRIDGESTNPLEYVSVDELVYSLN